jgi:hypothetical protein
VKLQFALRATRDDGLPASEIPVRFDIDEATVQPSPDHAGSFPRGSRNVA